MTALGFICPFRGVHPFTKEDNTFFAGRESEIQQVISKLYSSKLTIFYGESGCGKTSLIRAGLIPAMETPDHRVAVVLFRDWQSADFEETLRRGVLKSLLLVINRLRAASMEFSEYHEDGSPAFEEDLAELEEWFCKALVPEPSASILTSEQLYREVPLDRFLIECCAVFEGRIFFIFDQFEEYLYYHPDGSTGSSFDTALARAINDPEVPASFMFSLRDDGLGKLDRLRPRIPSLLTNVFRLEHLSIDGANAAMTIPLQKYLDLTGIEVQIEPALQAKLINQVREDRIGFEDVYLPPREIEPLAANLRYRALFLQIILTRLWEKDISPGKNGTIRLETFEGYSAPGSKRQSEETEARYIVRTYFDDLLSGLSEDDQDLAAEVLRFLVRSGGQKKAATAKRLATDTGAHESKIEILLENLSSQKLDSHGHPRNLLRKVGSSNPPMYEFVHDVMGLALGDWCDRKRELLARRRQAEELDKVQAQKQRELDLAEAQKQRELDSAEIQKQLELELAETQKQAELRLAAAQNQRELELAEIQKQKELEMAETLRKQELGATRARLRMRYALTTLICIVTPFVYSLYLKNRRLDITSNELQSREFTFQSRSYLLQANNFEIHRQRALRYAADAVAEHRRARKTYGAKFTDGVYRARDYEPLNHLQALMAAIALYNDYNLPSNSTYDSKLLDAVNMVYSKTKQLKRDDIPNEEVKQLLLAARLLSNESEYTPKTIERRLGSSKDYGSLLFSQVVWEAVNNQKEPGDAMRRLEERLDAIDIPKVHAKSIVEDRKQLKELRSRIWGVDEKVWTLSTKEIEWANSEYAKLSKELQGLDWLDGKLSLDPNSRIAGALLEQGDRLSWTGVRKAEIYYEEARKFAGTETSSGSNLSESAYERFQRRWNASRSQNESDRAAAGAVQKVAEGDEAARKGNRQKSINDYLEAIRLNDWLKGKLDPDDQFTIVSKESTSEKK